MTKIIIDPGHGGRDPGACGHGIKEKDYTLKISLYQAKRLKEHGFNVVMTRDTDTTLSNSVRTARVRNSGAKICISNHVNSARNPQANGAETIHSIYSNGKLANMILDALVKAGFNRRKAFSKRGKRGDYYFMCRETGAVETVIVEHGFITNAGDVQKLKNNWKQFAEADVKAICEYFDVRYKGGKQDVKPTKVHFGDKTLSGFIKDKKTFVELRKLCELLGLKVNFNSKTKTTEVIE